jgi:hypothetical protein
LKLDSAEHAAFFPADRAEDAALFPADRADFRRRCGIFFPQIAQIFAEDAAFVFLPARHFCLKAQTYAEGFSA